MPIEYNEIGKTIPITSTFLRYEIVPIEEISFKVGYPLTNVYIKSISPTIKGKLKVPSVKIKRI